MEDSKEDVNWSLDKNEKDSWIPPYEFLDNSSECIDDANPGPSAATVDACNVSNDDQVSPNNKKVANLKRLFWVSTTGLFLMFGIIPKVVYIFETLHSLQTFFCNPEDEVKNTFTFCLSCGVQENIQETLTISMKLAILFWIIRLSKPAGTKLQFRLGLEIGNKTILRKADKRYSLIGHWMFEMRIGTNNENLTVLPVSGDPSKPRNKEGGQQHAPHPPNDEAEDSQLGSDLNQMSLEEADEQDVDPGNQIRITSNGDTEDETRVQTKESNEEDVPLPGDSGYSTKPYLSVSGIFPCSTPFKMLCENDVKNHGSLVIPSNELTKRVHHLKDCRNAECVRELRLQNKDFNSSSRRRDIHNVYRGTIDDIFRFFETQKKGGVIIDEELFRSVDRKRFELGKEYQKLGKKGDNIVCKTEQGFYFMLKRIPKDLFSFHQLRNYASRGPHQRFLPALYGVFIDQAFVDVFLSYRNGVTLGQVFLNQQMWTVIQKLMLVTNLLEGIQVLHQQGIALLGVNAACIDLDKEHEPSSLMFTNVQFSEYRGRLDRTFPAYSPPESVQQPSLLSCKRYDMWGAGVVLYRLFAGESIWFQELMELTRVFPGDSVIADIMIEKIQIEAGNIQQKVVNIDQRLHRALPPVVHLLLCLLNPNEERRAASEDIVHHALFHSAESGASLEWSLRNVSTKGHQNRHCIVTVTNKLDIVYVTAVPRGYTLHQLLTDSRFLEQVPGARRFYRPSDRSNPCTFEEDTVLEIDFR